MPYGHCTMFTDFVGLMEVFSTCDANTQELEHALLVAMQNCPAIARQEFSHLADLLRYVNAELQESRTRKISSKLVE